jgi:hypothetical protein
MKRIFTALLQKWPDYLLEILVITIGILGAFALNNWNDKRLDRLEEVEILLSVKNDLENTISEFEFLNGIRNSVLYGTTELFKLSNSNNLQKDELDSLIGLTFYRPTFNNKQGAIDLLFTSGKINMIQNKEIRSSLISWPGSIDDMIEEEIYANNLFLGPYYQLLVDYVIIQDLLKKILSISFFGPIIYHDSFTEISQKADYQGLFNDKRFFNHLSMRATNMQITIEESQTLISQARGIIKQIDEEIDQ